MLATQQNLIDEIREELGNPLETVLPNSTIVTFINKGLYEYSRYRPLKVYKLLNLQEGVSSYPVDEDVTNVLDVVFAQTTEIPLGTIDMEGSVVGDIQNISLTQNPSLATIMFQKLDALNEMFEHEWDYENGNISIYPIPTESGFLVYMATKTHDLVSFPEKDKELLKKFVVGQSLITLGRKRNKNIKNVPTSAGNMTFDDGSTYLKDGKELINEFYKTLGTRTSAVVIG